MYTMWSDQKRHYQKIKLPYVCFLQMYSKGTLNVEINKMVTILTRYHNSLLWPRTGLNQRPSMCKTNVITISNTRRSNYISCWSIFLLSLHNVKSKLSCCLTMWNMFDNKNVRKWEDAELGATNPRTLSNISYSLCTQQGRLWEIDYQK